MMKKKLLFSLLKCKTFNLLAIVFVFNISFAQNKYDIQYQNRTIEIPNNIDTFQWNQMPESSKLDNGYFGWVQFFETPTQNIQESFKANNLQLLEYIPNKAYLFYFKETASINFLKASGVRSIVPVEGTFKLSLALQSPPYESWAMDGNNILVTLQHHKNVSTAYVINELALKQITVTQQYEGSNNIDLSIPNNCLEALSNLPYVKWVELIVAPDVKDDTRGRSLHRSSGLDTQTGVGRNYTGVGIGVMCRDDGIVGPHIDFQGRITNLTSDPTGTHGDGVSGIMAGAGNLNPSNRGMAAGSNLFVVNYVSNFLDSPTQNLINSGDVQITNSSYSNGCNAGYTSITQTVDQQTLDTPSLLHVFSAGNSNNNNCGYGAGSQWGNITGGHKQGKNVIATANVFFNGSLVNSSSRGPAHDGRIKPDIAANGQNQISTNPNNAYQSFGGTSGAAPGIAGISAQLYELYGDVNGGALPPSALIKASLLNTANDAGNVGPDFKFGWGIVNGLRAGMLIEDGRYLTDMSIQGDSNNHSIAVPAGTAQVRFMVYWSDPAASAGASPALVNDLDLVVTDPSSNTHLPWLLDHTPNTTALDTPATNGVDHLNNVEQVLIDSPVAGNYDIEVTGFNVPVGPQEYFVVYEIISENITVTYPNAGEHFVPGETEEIHWDTFGVTTDYDLEYSTDNGNTWNTIITVPNNFQRYTWTVPNEVSGACLFRVSSGAFSDESDATFDIAELVTNVDITEICPGTATIEWNAVTDAESYDVYLLGDNYMEVVENTTATTATIAVVDINDPIWVAVVVKNDTEGWQSRRTIAINHPGGLLNCSINNDIGTVSIDNDPNEFNFVCSGTSEIIVSATFRNSGLDPQSNFTVSYQLGSDPVVEETYTGTLASGDQDSYIFTTPLVITDSGAYNLTVSSNLPGDENAFNDEQILPVFAYVNTSSIFYEPFDVNGMPPAGWKIENPDESLTWEEKDITVGSDGNPTKTAYINNSNYFVNLESDRLFTDIYDLSGLTSINLIFDLAKAQSAPQNSDILQIHASTDCGETFTSIYNKAGLNLSTLPDYNATNNWEPTETSHWRRESIDISQFAGELVLFRFTNICRNGNSTYIDNVFVDDLLSVSENNLAQTISLYPNPTSNEVIIKTHHLLGDTFKIVLTNSLGQQLQHIDETSIQGAQATLDVSNYASGLYFVTISIDGQTATKKLLIK